MAAENKKLDKIQVSDSVFITVETQRRIIKDVRDILRHPLHDQGIYYVHDDTNIMEGLIMITGPEDTPYEDGMYIFEIQFPENYPYSPPIVKMITQDGVTRFHPNFYRNGKVCLSILNTWRGEGWTSCQTLRSVLLTLMTRFTEKALLHEPGIHENDERVNLFDCIISHENLKAPICNVLRSTDDDMMYVLYYSKFHDVINKHITKTYDRILEKVKDIDTPTQLRFTFPMYNMRFVSNLVTHEMFSEIWKDSIFSKSVGEYSEK